MYKKSLLNDKIVIRISDGANIPDDPRNMDYVDYLKWVEDGNEPLPADPLPVIVPSHVSMTQARIALINAGLFDTINEGLKTLPLNQRTIALVAWEYAPTVSRNGTLVTTLAKKFNLTDKQLDDLFIAADAIKL